jgi:capsular exopolysaccharide synthesis family protein
LWLFQHNWKRTAIAVVTSTLIAGILSFAFSPVYESVARLAVDFKTPTAVVGPGTESVGIASEADQYFNTALQLVQSDVVLRPVAEQFNLLPEHRVPASAPNIAPSEAPVALKDLKVTHPANSFIIQIAYRSKDPGLAAQVANAVARSYIAQGHEMRAHASGDESTFMEDQINELKKKMDNSAAALAAYQNELGIINPEEKTRLVSSQISQLNTELTEAQEDRVRKQVDYKSSKSGRLAAVQISPQAVSLDKLDEAVRTAQAKMAMVKSVYGANSTDYKKAANELAEAKRQQGAMRVEIARRIKMEYVEAKTRERLLGAALKKAKAQSDSLDARSMEYEQLKRESESDKALYTELFRKVKEAGINGAFHSSEVRLADPARPRLRPVFPDRLAFLAAGFLFSLTGSVGTILVADLSDRSLRDPEQVRNTIGVEVLGVLPNVTEFENLFPISSSTSVPSNRTLMTLRRWFETSAFYRESSRRLLSTILLGQYGHPIRSVLVTSAGKGEGKSSCVAHLATIHALQGYRVLLIDADLRCPVQHRIFGLDGSPGLTDAILANMTLAEIKHRVNGIGNLDVIPAGNGGPEGCAHVAGVVSQVIKDLGDRYDTIFIDAPPILYFAEPLQLSCIADGVVVLCRAGQTTQQAVIGVLSALDRLGVSTLGVVLNQVRTQMSSNYSPYQTYYRHGRRVDRLSA